MSTRFVNVDRDTPMMLPPDLRDWVAKDDILHFVIDAVELLDLREFKINRKGTGSRQYPPGFTHFCDKSRKKRFKVGRKTDRKKFNMKIKETNEWLRKIRNAYKVKEWWPILCAKLRGHFQYYGVSGNFRSISRFYYLTIRLVFKWLNRRSQKKSFNWKRFSAYVKKHGLPQPKIYHNVYTLFGY